MDTLMSLPMTASVLTEYGDLEEACRSCGCDGLEAVSYTHLTLPTN